MSASAKTALEFKPNTARPFGQIFINDTSLPRLRIPQIEGHAVDPLLRTSRLQQMKRLLVTSSVKHPAKRSRRKIGSLAAPIVAVICLSGNGIAQTPASSLSSATTLAPSVYSASAQKTVARGVGEIAKGAGMAALSAVSGTLRAAGDLVVIHPTAAVADLTGGVADSGRSLSTGAAKGAMHIIEGARKALKHLL